MANYSERECSSFVDACHCERAAIDEVRERLVVGRLDRCELEDRHLRLLEELTTVKKLANEQSDKIKRLATKLLRFGANSRVICVADDQERIGILEAENCKLRNKLFGLKTQLANRKIFGRPPSSTRGRKHPLGSTSRPNTCRSESSRLKSSSCQCLNELTNDDQNYAIKVQELEAEKKALQARVEELELEHASCASGMCREKVAENVEYIRLWRQMKQQNEKLEAAQAANELLSQQIAKLKSQLDESQKSNSQLNAELASERKQVDELDDDLSRYKRSQGDLREKEERISDLSGEMDILRQHNRELLDLSSKFDRVEQENAELKRQISDHSNGQLSLRDELDKEQANVKALRAANDELLRKVDDLQKQLDVANIQLMEGQSCPRPVPAKPKSAKASQTTPMCGSTNPELCKYSDQYKGDPLAYTASDESVPYCNCCIPGYRRPSQQLDKGIQTTSVEDQQRQSTAAQTCDDIISANGAREADNDKTTVEFQPPVRERCANNNSKTLSRESMLKLLEQVQIGSPMETKPSAAVVVARRSRTTAALNLESMLFGDS